MAAQPIDRAAQKIQTKKCRSAKRNYGAIFRG
jgi:hypothetical protein